MSTPNMAEVLREEAQKAERLRILLMALDCKDLGELIQKLKAEDQKYRQPRSRRPPENSRRTCNANHRRRK